jgi:hypothetical protein
VPHRCDRRDAHGGHGPRHRLAVERPEVLARAPTPPHDHHVHRDPVDQGQRPPQFRFRRVSLHAGRDEHDLDGRPPAPQHRHDVAQRGTVRARHHADAGGHGRQPPLPRRVQQAVAPEGLAGALEPELPLAFGPRGQELPHREPELAALLPHRGLGVREDLGPSSDYRHRCATSRTGPAPRGRAG